MLFWYKLGIHGNVPHDTSLPNCSISNKWPSYIQTTLWICGPNNVTRKVNQNSLFQTNMDCCWTIQPATSTKTRRVFKHQLILNHRIVTTYSESLTHIKIISHKLSPKCFVFKIVQAPWNKIATSNESYECYILTLTRKNHPVVTVMFGLYHGFI